MVQEWKTRAPRAASEPLRRPRRQDWLLWWPRRPYRPCTGFLRGHRRHPQIGVYITPFGDVPERTGCGLFLRAEKQAVACVPERERKARIGQKTGQCSRAGKKSAPRAPRSPCHRSLTFHDVTVRSPSEAIQVASRRGTCHLRIVRTAMGTAPQGKPDWPPHRGRSEETSGRASIPGNRSSPRGSSIRTCVELARSRSGP
jgi:hypothetical protein